MSRALHQGAGRKQPWAEAVTQSSGERQPQPEIRWTPTRGSKRVCFCGWSMQISSTLFLTTMGALDVFLVRVSFLVLLAFFAGL